MLQNSQTRRFGRRSFVLQLVVLKFKRRRPVASPVRSLRFGAVLERLYVPVRDDRRRAYVCVFRGKVTAVRRRGQCQRSHKVKCKQSRCCGANPVLLVQHAHRLRRGAGDFRSGQR